MQTELCENLNFHKVQFDHAFLSIEEKIASGELLEKNFICFDYTRVFLTVWSETGYCIFLFTMKSYD